MALNKNQTKFFIAAVNYFGIYANDVRLKDINEFASANDLIVPTSALKSLCQDEGTTRGHYNLLLAGFEPNETPPEEEPEETFHKEEESSVIIDTPAFVKPPTPKKPKVVEVYTPEPGQKKKEWKNPVYVVANQDGDVVGIHETLQGAFKRRMNVLHDNGMMSFDEFKKRMEYVGGAIITSSNASSIHCLIEIKEIEQ